MLRALAMALPVLALASTAQAEAEEEATVYEIPGETVFPEGIAYDPDSGHFYVGATDDGTIFRGEPGTAEMEVFVEGDGEDAPPTAYGMKVDDHGRLWIAGGPSGQIFVHDTEDGSRIDSFTVPEAESNFVNDLIVHPDGHVYATDSHAPVLYRVDASQDEIGELEEWLDLDGTPIEYRSGEGVEGVNLNGIEVSADGNHLITVQMNTGQLFRIDIETQEVAEIDLGGERVVNGDGLVLEGNRLYVVQLVDEEIAVIELSEDLASGEVLSRFTHEAFSWPATAALVNGELVVVNTQFHRRETEDPDLPFTVVGIPVDMLD